MKISHKFAISLGTSLLVYLFVALALVYFPMATQPPRPSFDFSSVKTSAANQALAEESSMPMRDGARLFFREYSAATADTTLILLHGSGSESRYLSKLAADLTSGGRVRVLTPDLRGHGRSSLKKGDIDYLGQYDDDLEDMIKYARTRYPDSALVLGGHSSGGGLVLRYAGESSRQSADGYVFLAPYLSHKSPTVKPDSGGWASVNIRRIIGISMLENIGLHNFDSLRVIHFNLPQTLADPLQTPAYSFRLLMSLESSDYRAAIKHLNRPSLVLVGDKDEAFYPELFSAEFAPASALVQVDLIAGAKHLDFLTNQYTENLLKNWLSDTSFIAAEREPTRLVAN